jgi:ribosomal protein L31
VQVTIRNIKGTCGDYTSITSVKINGCTVDITIKRHIAYPSGRRAGKDHGTAAADYNKDYTEEKTLSIHTT